MKMPFGKFKGEDFEDVPTDYLQWVAATFDNRPELQKEAEEQLAMREGRGVPRSKEN